MMRNTFDAIMAIDIEAFRLYGLLSESCKYANSYQLCAPDRVDAQCQSCPLPGFCCHNYTVSLTCFVLLVYPLYLITFDRQGVTVTILWKASHAA